MRKKLCNQQCSAHIFHCTVFPHFVLSMYYHTLHRRPPMYELTWNPVEPWLWLIMVGKGVVVPSTVPCWPGLTRIPDWLLTITGGVGVDGPTLYPVLTISAGGVEIVYPVFTIFSLLLWNWLNCCWRIFPVWASSNDWRIDADGVVTTIDGGDWTAKIKEKLWN